MTNALMALSGNMLLILLLGPIGAIIVGLAGILTMAARLSKGNPQ